jgi:hypothetical protein
VPIAPGERHPTHPLGFRAGQIELPDVFATLGQEEIKQLFLEVHETAA